MAETEAKSDLNNPPAGRFLWSRDLLLTALMGVAGLAAVGGFGILFSLWLQSREPDTFDKLRLASQQFVDGERIIAGNLAERVNLDPQREDEAQLLPLRDFLVGAGRVQRAMNELDAGERRERFYEAIAPLQAAHDREFPAGRQAEGNRLLAISLFKLGRYREAIPHFVAAFEADPTMERQFTPMLAQAHLRALPGDPGRALIIIREYLRDRTLPIERRREAELIEIDSLSDLGRWRDAEQLIKQARQADTSGGTSDFQNRLTLLQAEMQIRKGFGKDAMARVEAGKGTAGTSAVPASTLKKLGELQRTASPKIAARARLLNARIHLAKGETNAALAELTQVRQQQPFAGEGIAGALTEVELLADEGRGREAVLTTRYLVRELGNPKQFDGSLVSFPEFRRRLEAAVNELRLQQQFESAIDTARALSPLLGPTEAKLQEAIAYRDWAETTLSEQESRPGDPERRAERLARRRFRAAGDAFAEAAQLEFTTDQYVPTLWSAIDAYQRARHFQRSLKLLKPYLKYELRLQRPRGLLAKAKALLAAGGEDNYREAILATTECIREYPRNPLAYDARLLAAHAHAELDELERARDLLQENLKDVELSPSNPVWRDSLFTLGELLYGELYANQMQASHAIEAEKLRLMKANRDLIEAAVRHLSEAVERYWPKHTSGDGKPASRTLYAAYLAARAHRIAAELPMLEAQAPEINSFVQRNLRQVRDRELGYALHRFTELRRFLEQRLDERGDDEANLPALQVSLLRNCRVGEADTLLEMGRYEDASAAYRAITLRYMDRPLALEGILGQAKCLRRSGRPREAEARLQQASQVLRRIPDEWNDQFEKVTRYDRQSWERLLAWMNNRNGAAAPLPTS